MSAAALIEEAYAANREKRFADAVAKARAALAIEPANVRAQTILALGLDGSGNPADAAAVVADLVRGDPEKLDYIYWHAVLLRKAGNSEEALGLAERLARLRPQSAEAHGHLGIVLAALGRPEEARAALARAVGLDPAHVNHRYNLALVLIDLGETAEAVEALRKVTSLVPDFAVGRLTLGEQLLKLGKAEAAVEQARLALAAQPGAVDAHFLLVRALANRSSGGSKLDDAEAEVHIHAALELDPDSYVANEMLGFALQERGDFAAAEAAFERSLSANHEQGAAYYGLATCRKFTTSDSRHLALFDRAARAGGTPLDRAYIHYASGKVAEDCGDFKGAIEHFDAANRLMAGLRQGRPFDRAEQEARTAWVIDTFDAAFFESASTLGTASDLPLLVVGILRSGTTLVEQILSSHPMIEGGGELMFWHDNAGRAFAPGLQELEPAQAESTAARYLETLRKIGPAAARVTDKLPENMLYLGLIHALFPHARIVHSRRHPVDTCLSIFATPYSSPPDFVYDRGNIVFAYRQYLRLMEHWRHVLPADRFLEVDYETLVADREAQTRRLIQFTGLPWDEACLHHERNARLVKTSSRWQVRQPIYRTSVARWKNFEPWLGEFADLLPRA